MRCTNRNAHTYPLHAECSDGEAALPLTYRNICSFQIFRVVPVVSEHEKSKTNIYITGPRQVLRAVCTPSFTAVPVRNNNNNMYASTACEDGFPSSQWIDLEDSILFWVHFRHIPTHRGSLAELAKSSASYVSGSRSLGHVLDILL